MTHILFFAQRLILASAHRRRMALSFWHQKRNKKCRLKIFLLKLVGWLGQYSPKNLLGRI
jgi:hypothetical protein